jgi:hypothetical protein
MDNATDWVVSNGQYALDFDGLNDHVSFTETRLPTLGVSSVFSASAWIFLPSLPSGRREIMPTPTIGLGQFGAQLEIDDGRLRIRADNGGVAAYTFVDLLQVAAGQWVHAGGTWNGVTKTATLYKNGSTAGSVSYAANTASDTVGNTWTWGALQYGGSLFFFMQGAIAEVSIHSRLLSENDFQALHAIGPGGMYQRRRRRAIYLPQAGFQAAWARGSNVMLGFNQP